MFERNKKRLLFKKRIKEINKAHKPDKCDARKPYNWKKEWGPYVKYQADWDHVYFLDLIIYKMERMRAELSIFSAEEETSLQKHLNMLDQIITLGKKIQDFDYYKEGHDFSDLHTTPYALVYKRDPSVHWSERLSCTELLKKLETKRPDLDSEHLTVDDILGYREAIDWCKDNGYTPGKDVTIATTAEWDSEENYKTAEKLFKQCAKDEQKDVDTFFKLIARHFREWWW